MHKSRFRGLSGRAGPPICRGVYCTCAHGGMHVSGVKKWRACPRGERLARFRRTATANRYMALVRAILRKACNDWEWLDRVPKVGMFKAADGRIRSLSREEFSRLLAELPEHLADMARFSVATGLRQANVTRLQWKQISLERRHLWVSGADHKNGRPHSVPLNQAAVDVLVKRQGDHPTHVFTYEGSPIVKVNTKAWRNALRRAEILDFRWHDLRHTFCNVAS